MLRLGVKNNFYEKRDYSMEDAFYWWVFTRPYLVSDLRISVNSLLSKQVFSNLYPFPPSSFDIPPVVPCRYSYRVSCRVSCRISCRVVFRVVSCCAVPCRVVIRVVSYRDVFRVLSCRVVSCRVSCRAMPCRAVLCRVVLCRAVLCYAVPCRNRDVLFFNVSYRVE